MDETNVVDRWRWTAADSSGESWIEKNPGVCGGEACIRRMRIPVWLLMEMRQEGAADEVLFECYPSLTPDDLAVAWAYYKTHKQEIDDEIALQNKAMEMDIEGVIDV